MPIQALAREDVVHASRDASMSELAQLMRDRTVGSVVITNDNAPVGIVTDRDLSTRVIAEEASMESLSAADVMTPNPTIAPADTGLYEAAQIMSENGVRRLPICDENNDLCGIITADDVIELLADEHQHLASIIQAQRPDY